MFLSTAPMGYLLVVLPLYLDRAGLDPAFIGGLYTVSGLVTASLVAFSGLLADRFGRRRFLLWGTALPVLSYALFAATTERGWLVAASVLGGVGLANGAAGALTVASFDALLAERVTAERRTRVFTSAQALWSLALATGAAAAGVPALLRTLVGDLGALDEYRPPFVVAIALTLLAAALLVPVRDEPAHAAPARRGWLPRRSVRPIAVYSLGIGLLGFGLGVAVQLMPLWFKLRFGTDEAQLGPWYAAAQLLSLLTVLVVPALDHRLGGARSVLVAQLASGALLALIVIAPVFPLAATLFLGRSFLTNLSWPFQQSLLMGAVLPEERASAVGMGFAAWSFASALGPLAGGALLAAGSLALPLLVGAVAYACAGAVFGIGFGAARAVRARAVPSAAPPLA